MSSLLALKEDNPYISCWPSVIRAKPLKHKKPRIIQVAIAKYLADRGPTPPWELATHMEQHHTKNIYDNIADLKVEGYIQEVYFTRPLRELFESTKTRHREEGSSADYDRKHIWFTVKGAIYAMANDEVMADVLKLKNHSARVALSDPVLCSFLDYVIEQMEEWKVPGKPKVEPVSEALLLRWYVEWKNSRGDTR